MSDIIFHKNTKNKTKLYALVQTQKNEGKDDLFTFLINKTRKKIKEPICTTWEITNSLSEIKSSRLEVLRDCLQMAVYSTTTAFGTSVRCKLYSKIIYL